MLDIIVLITLCRRLGEAARRKQVPPVRYQWLLILCWFVGEVGLVSFTAAVLEFLFDEDAWRYWIFIYLSAFAGGGLGAWFVFRAVARLPEPGPTASAHAAGAADPGAGEALPGT